MSFPPYGKKGCGVVWDRVGLDAIGCGTLWYGMGWGRLGWDQIGWDRMVWYGVVWYDTIRYRYGTGWYVYGTVWYGMMCYGMGWYGTVRYCMVRCRDPNLTPRGQTHTEQPNHTKYSVSYITYHARQPLICATPCPNIAALVIYCDFLLQTSWRRPKKEPHTLIKRRQIRRSFDIGRKVLVLQGASPAAWKAANRRLAYTCTKR